MTPWLNAFSFALFLSMFFAFRYQTWRRPVLVILYFLLFFTIEGVADVYVLPPHAIGIELAVVCLLLTIPFAIATGLSIWSASRGGPEGRDVGPTRAASEGDRHER